MKVYGIEITDAQIAAGRDAMWGQFRLTQVVGALERAGVTDVNWVSSRAADRLLQQERKAGRIRAVNNKLWERIA